MSKFSPTQIGPTAPGSASDNAPQPAGRRRRRLAVALAASVGLTLSLIAPTAAWADDTTLRVNIALGTSEFLDETGTIEHAGVVDFFDANGVGVEPVLSEPTLVQSMFGLPVDVSLPPGDYKIRASVDGFLPSWLSSTEGSSIDDIDNLTLLNGFIALSDFDDAAVLTVGVDGIPAVPSVYLWVHESESAIAGAVMEDAINHDFIEGATVELYPVGQNVPVATVVSDELGGYVFDNVPGGTYELRFMGPGSPGVEQWWPFESDRADARAFTMPETGGYWMVLNANLSEPSNDDLGFEASLIGDPVAGGTVTLNVSDYESTEIPDFTHVNNEVWMLDGVPVLGATGDSFTIPSNAEGASLSVTADIYAWVGVVHMRQTTEPVIVGPSPLPVLTSAPIPSVAGSPAVGLTLKSTLGTWGPGAVAKSFQWMRDGAAIPNATARNYVVTADDVGASVTFSVTGEKPGYATAVRVSEPLTVTAGDMTATPVPRIRGAATVGNTLTAASGNWRPAGATLEYQWARDGVPVASGEEYLITVDDLGAVLTIRVTATLPGYTSASTMSLPTAAVGEGKIQGTKPTITAAGGAVVGATLVADAGEWTPSSIVLSYQWMRAGVPIDGADTASYVLRPEDVRTKVRVVVTGEQPGYTTKTMTSAATGKVLAG